MRRCVPPQAGIEGGFANPPEKTEIDVATVRP
jgi:hypothetical protein